jgi:hypothetical protein
MLRAGSWVVSSRSDEEDCQSYLTSFCSDHVSCLAKSRLRRNAVLEKPGEKGFGNWSSSMGVSDDAIAAFKGLWTV